jgi:hypothetical protein
MLSKTQFGFRSGCGTREAIGVMRVIQGSQLSHISHISHIFKKCPILSHIFEICPICPIFPDAVTIRDAKMLNVALFQPSKLVSPGLND